MEEFHELAIYLDESGSTGSNFLDPAQPYFAQGGFVIQKQHETNAIDVYKKWERKHLQYLQKEIKGKSLFKRTNGFSIFEELLDDMASFIICPTYAILDKRYGLCFTAIEAFLDSYYNPTTTNNEFFDGSKKAKWAESFYKALDMHTLSLLNNIILKGDASLINDTQISIADNLSAIGENEIARKVLACPTKDAFEFLFNKNKSISANAMCFHAHIFSINDELSKHPPNNCFINYDDQKDFAKLFSSSLQAITSGNLCSLPIGPGKSIVCGKVCDWSISFIPSHTNELVRMADLCSTYLNLCLVELNSTGDAPDNNKSLFTKLWTPVLRLAHPHIFKEFPQWYYEAIPLEMFAKIGMNLK